MKPYGLILAGGKSSRMGFDKAFLDFHGEPQVNWLYKLLKLFCDRVFISGNPNKIIGDFDFIEDHYETGGPMNGILSAFLSHPKVAWLVTPVDMPNVDEEVISCLIKNRNENKIAAGFLNKDNLMEPLPVLLEPTAYPILLDRFLLGDTSLNSFLKTANATRITVSDSSWLININSPEQLLK